MRVGVPTEIKNHEYRVGLTPPSVRELVANGHEGLIQAGQASAWVVDCSAVEKSSSVGLSLLLALLRDAQAQKKGLTLRALPEDMRQIAQVCGLTELLPLQG